MKSHITFIGAGNMAGALIGGLLADGVAPDLLTATDPSTEKCQALRAADERRPFRQLVAADEGITAALSPEDLERVFDDEAWLTHVDDVIGRLEGLDG